MNTNTIGTAQQIWLHVGGMFWEVAHGHAPKLRWHVQGIKRALIG